MEQSIRSETILSWADPALVFNALYRQRSHVVWLDNGEDAHKGVSYLAAAEAESDFVTADARAGTVSVSRPASPGYPVETRVGTIFEALSTRILETDVASTATPAFRLGWMGWFGYGLSLQTLNVDMSVDSQSSLPDAAFLFVDRAIAFDHESRTITLMVSSSVNPTASRRWLDRLGRVIAALAERGAVAAEPSDFHASRPRMEHVWRHDGATYTRLIRRCQEAIFDGDAYVLCLTNEIRSSIRPDPAAVFQRLRRSSPSHHSALMRFGRHSIVSASPEQFLLVTANGRIRTKPIKGTRARSPVADVDSILASDLRDSLKERAENIMIVDLMRNDLSKVSQLGSVTVPRLLHVESYSHVHQLVSTVESVRADGVTTLDVVAACFPAGSMTGTPKVRAVQILNALEMGGRGAYAGAFGYIGVDGAADLAVTIRTIVIDSSGTRIGTGGGITSLSDPDSEVAETWIKARPLMAAVDEA